MNRLLLELEFYRDNEEQQIPLICFPLLKKRKFKEKVVLLLILSVYTLSIGNNIARAVVQRDTTYNKTLP